MGDHGIMGIIKKTSNGRGVENMVSYSLCVQCTLYIHYLLYVCSLFSTIIVLLLYVHEYYTKVQLRHGKCFPKLQGIHEQFSEMTLSLLLAESTPRPAPCFVEFLRKLRRANS
jgi:hypothetical protein